MAGIGCFMKETRALYVVDWKMPLNSKNPVQEMYEIAWRHFCVWVVEVKLKSGRSRGH